MNSPKRNIHNLIASAIFLILVGTLALINTPAQAGSYLHLGYGGHGGHGGHHAYGHGYPSLFGLHNDYGYSGYGHNTFSHHRYGYSSYGHHYRGYDYPYARHSYRQQYGYGHHLLE